MLNKRLETGLSLWTNGNGAGQPRVDKVLVLNRTIVFHLPLSYFIRPGKGRMDPSSSLSEDYCRRSLGVASSGPRVLRVGGCS